MRTIITFKCFQPSHRPSSLSLQNLLFLLLDIVIFFAPVVIVAEQVSERLLELYQSTRKIKQLQEYFLQGSSSFIQITKQFRSFASTAEATECRKQR